MSYKITKPNGKLKFELIEMNVSFISMLLFLWGGIFFVYFPKAYLVLLFMFFIEGKCKLSEMY